MASITNDCIKIEGITEKHLLLYIRPLLGYKNKITRLHNSLSSDYKEKNL